MGGGLIQLVAYGSQDMYLTGNPQITFFKVVYRRHTNFSIESVKQSGGEADFGKTVSWTLQRNGDLVHKMYLQIAIPEIKLTTSATQHKAFRWLNWLGHVICKNIELTIGGTKIDKHYGEWLHLWNELSNDLGKSYGYAEMVGNVPKMTQIHHQGVSVSSTKVTDAYTLYVPLQFWFCRNPGLALPIIALQYSDVNVNVEFRELDECIWANTYDTSGTFVSQKGKAVVDSDSVSLGSNTTLYVDYIYLDTDERRRFAQVSHEYLIETVQFRGDVSITGTGEHSVKLNFSHPVKEIVWVSQAAKLVDSDFAQIRAGRQWFNYTDSWDFTGFTGTPESSNGPGMIGGKTPQNLFHGLPSVRVNGGTAGSQNIGTGWASDTTSLTATTAGYTYVSQYTDTGATNKYGDRNVHEFTGVTKNGSRTLVRSVDFTASSANIDSGAMTVPANSLVTECTALVTTDLAYASATLGVSFGTAAGGTQLTGTLDANSLVNTSTSLAAGFGNSTRDELNTQLGGQAAIAFTTNAGEFSSETSIHGRVVASTGAFTAGTVLFMVTYTSLNNNEGIWGGRGNGDNTKIPVLDSGENPTATALIRLNGNERFSVRDGFYFNVVQPYQHHTNCPAPGINVYSFAITPEEHQPSGTCNFSRIDNKELVITLSSTAAAGTFGNTKVRAYAINYNILRIMSGMGGLAYSS
jgi:hypothetical protein